MAKTIRSFLKDEQGATAIEYTILAGFFGIMCVGAAVSLKDEIVSLFEGIVTAMNKL